MTFTYAERGMGVRIRSSARGQRSNAYPGLPTLLGHIGG